MPTVSQTMIKAAMVYLTLALLVRGASAMSESWSTALGPVWWHLLTVGWLTQLILAVAWWMFPTLRGRPKHARRGDERWMWATALALNLGLIARVVGEPLHGAAPGLTSEVLLWLGAILQLGAVLIAVGLLWPRVRPARQRPSKPARASVDAS